MCDAAYLYCCGFVIVAATAGCSDQAGSGRSTDSLVCLHSPPLTSTRLHARARPRARRQVSPCTKMAGPAITIDWVTESLRRHKIAARLGAPHHEFHICSYRCVCVPWLCLDTVVWLFPSLVAHSGVSLSRLRVKLAAECSPGRER